MATVDDGRFYETYTFSSVKCDPILSHSHEARKYYLFSGESDIDSPRAQTAYAYIKQRGLTQFASIVIGDAARLPFCDNAFDLIIAADTWEHLLEPDQSLLTCHRVTKIGGAIYISFMPYYSPWGAHIWDWIAIPWLHVCLPRRWLLTIIREVECLYQVNTQRAIPVRLDWYNEQDPAHARRLTVARFEKSVRKSKIQMKQLVLLPVGFQVWQPVASFISCLATLPGLRELLTGLVVCVLRKERNDVK